MTNDQIYYTKISKSSLTIDFTKQSTRCYHVLDLSYTNTCEILPGMRPQNETHHLKYRILLKVMFITITLTYNGYVKIR